MEAGFSCATARLDDCYFIFEPAGASSRAPSGCDTPDAQHGDQVMGRRRRGWLISDQQQRKAIREAVKHPPRKVVHIIGLSALEPKKPSLNVWPVNAVCKACGRKRLILPANLACGDRCECGGELVRAGRRHGKREKGKATRAQHRAMAKSKAFHEQKLTSNSWSH